MFTLTLTTFVASKNGSLDNVVVETVPFDNVVVDNGSFKNVFIENVSFTNVENGSFKKVLGNLKLGKWNRRVRSQIIPTFCWQGTHLNFIQIKRLNEFIKVTNSVEYRDYLGTINFLPLIKLIQFILSKMY